MSRLVDFYAGAGKDHAGRKIDEIWAWDEDRLENVHDYIQWLFPNRNPSQFNPHAPLLTDEDAEAFKNSTFLSSRLLRSFDMMCTFYRVGSMQCKRAGVDEGPPYWWDSLQYSHNWLRITRIMLCMTEVGYQENAKIFLECIEKATLPDNKTRLFWRAAAGMK